MDHAGLTRDGQMQLARTSLDRDQVTRSAIGHPNQARRFGDLRDLRQRTAAQRIAPRHPHPIGQRRQPDTVEPVRHAAPVQPKARAGREPGAIERRHAPG